MKLRPVSATTVLALLLPLAACASAPDDRVADGAQTSIPYVRSNGISEWRVVSEDSLYIKGLSGDWYLVRTMNRCPRLRTALSLGFVTSGLDQLDRSSTILAEGQRCPVASVIRSEPPPQQAAS